MKNLSALAAVLIAAAGVAAGFAGYRLLSHHAAEPLVASSVPAPQASTAEAPPDAPPVPDSIPEIRMPDLQGQMRSMSEYAGHPRIINFWATWCGPCRREIPLLNSLQHSHQGEHLQVIGIAIDFDKAVQDYVKKTRMDYPVLIGEDAGLEAAQKFGISDLVLPFSVFADAKNRVVAVKIGELHAAEAEFILKAIGKLDAGQADLPATRTAIEDDLKNEAQHRAEPAAPAS